MKKILTVTLLLSAIVILLVLVPKLTTSPALQNTQKQTDATITIGTATLAAEIAITPQQQAQGLSNRDWLADNTGMLFDFTNSYNKQPSFWMKDMRFSIDIIWISQGTIVHIDTNVPVPATTHPTLQTYSPPGSIDYVLEVNAGFSQVHNINIGDQVIIKQN